MTLQTRANRLVTVLPGSVALENVKYRRVRVGASGTGNVDLYTVPAGRVAQTRGMVFYRASNPSATLYRAIKISGVYYRVGIDGTVANNTTAVSSVGNLIFLAGEAIAVNTTQSVNVNALVVEYDATSRLRRALLTSLASGDNTVYTAPGPARILNSVGLALGTGSGGDGIVTYVNDSGGTRTRKVYIVPNGQVRGDEHFVSTGTTSAGGVPSLFIPGSVGNGDRVVINTDAATATQMAFLLAEEF